MSLCTICCRCGRWWFGPTAEPPTCLGQWQVKPETNQWFYNSCGHKRCGGCGEGELPLPCEGPKRVIREPNAPEKPKKLNRKKKNRNRNRKSSRKR